MQRPSFELLSHEPTERANLCLGEIALLVLRIGVEHVANVVAHGPIVDHAPSATLSPSLSAPAELANAATARDHRALFRPQQERDLEGTVFLVGKLPGHEASEYRSLDKALESMYAN